MSRSRRLPPLFEVMRETNPLTRGGGAARHTTAAPTPAPPPPPPPPVLRRSAAAAEVEIEPRLNGAKVLRPISEDVQGGDEGNGGGWRGWGGLAGLRERMPALLDLNRSYTVHARAGLIGLGVLVALLFVAYAAGHKLGAIDAKERLLPAVPGDWAEAGSGAAGTPPAASVHPPTRPNDPLVAGNLASRPGSQAPLRTTPSSGRTNAAAPPPEPSGTLTPSSAVVLQDPRIPGFNYITIQQVPRMDEAAATAEFLTGRGIPSLTFPLGPVDPAAPGAKNGPQWLIIVAEAISSADYKRSPRKDELLREVKKLGAEWKKNPKGRFDFDSSLWMLKKPTDSETASAEPNR